jgi:hypothetical protein
LRFAIADCRLFIFRGPDDALAIAGQGPWLKIGNRKLAIGN